ncbi:MAG: hypothetical protein OXM58_11695 [Rhodospirillaceae bacterium]|nr:hypothetical protein [Rhodospirillaceae bacterium]MDE0619299.1 hypothetical protein [Rhodospirillaceae bacterium]
MSAPTSRVQYSKTGKARHSGGAASTADSRDRAPERIAPAAHDPDFDTVLDASRRYIRRHREALKKLAER